MKWMKRHFVGSAGQKYLKKVVFAQIVEYSLESHHLLPYLEFKLNWPVGVRGFFAWSIDLIVIGIFLSPIKLFLVYPGFVWDPSFIRWIPFVDFRLDNLVSFLYWMLMDGTYGQSIGKMALRLKVTRPTGNSIDIGNAAIESIGKAFLLPLDCYNWLDSASRT